jgi:hypothetical protein
MNAMTQNQPTTLKTGQKAARKSIPSKLDPFTDELLRMDAEKKSLQDMQEWLKFQGVETSVNNVSVFLVRRRAKQQLDREKNVVEAFQEWMEENPNPTLEALIERFKMLALNLSMKKEAAPEVLNLADKLAGTAIRFVNAQSREAYRTRKLVMEEENHAEAKQARQARALELCLAKSKKYPEAAAAFQAAFDALDRAEGILA